MISVHPFKIIDLAKSLSGIVDKVRLEQPGTPFESNHLPVDILGMSTGYYSDDLGEMKNIWQKGVSHHSFMEN